MRRPTVASIATLVAVAGAALFIFVQLQPGLLFTDTTANGGDMGAHVWGPAFMRDHLLPHGRITGWAPDWYAGFAFPTFYFPLPSLLIVLLDVLLPYEVAFKLITVSGLVSLPVAAWAFGKLAGLKAPGPACLAAATLPFLFDRTFTIYGGNIASTLAGEYSYSISLSLAMVFLGVFARMLETGKHRALAAALMALTLLSHVVPTFFAVVGAVVLILMRPSVRRTVDTAVVGILSGLLTAFWALPFLFRLPYTNDMAYEKETKYYENLFPTNLRWLLFMAVVGALVSLGRRCRVGMFLTIMAGLSAVAFRFVPQGKIWNPRVLPFWFLCLSLLAGIAVASVAWLVMFLTRNARAQALAAEQRYREWSDQVETQRLASMAEPWDDEVAAARRPDPEGYAAAEEYLRASRAWIKAAVHEYAGSAGAVAAVLLSMLFVSLPLHVPFVERLPLIPETTDRSYIPDWAKWNYNGYERKASWPEHKSVIDTMKRVGRTVGCGRAHWEYEPELDQLGTPLALMLLPYWTDGCIGSMEGLYFESSATTPYHFLSASELSRRASRPQRGLAYKDFDLTLGVRHLQMLGSRYYMAFTAEAKAAATLHPDLQLVASTPAFPVNYPSGPGQRSWEIYEVTGSAIVEPLVTEPVVVRGVAAEKDWLATSAAWFLDPARWTTYLAAGGPAEWRRVDRGEAAGAPAEVLPAPSLVSGVEVRDDRISFDVDEPGSPIMVKASYFPNWQASGADGPWRISPNMMVVVPTARHVELHYGRTGVDYAGTGLTVAGLVALVVVAVRSPRRVRRLEASAAAAKRQAQADEPPNGAQGAAEDGRARWAGLADGDRDLGDGVAGSFGPQHELGVEQVGAEPAPLHDWEERATAHDFHPVGVRDPETEAAPEDDRED